MIGFEYVRFNQQRVEDLRREAAGIVAARQAGASTSAKRIARMLRGVAARIDGGPTALGTARSFTVDPSTTTPATSQPSLNRLRGLAR